MANIYPVATVQTWAKNDVAATVAAWLETNPGKTVAEIATGTSLTTDQVYWALLNPTAPGQFIVVPGTDDELIVALGPQG